MRSDGFSFRNHQSMISFINVNKAFNRDNQSVKSFIFIYRNQTLYLYHALYYFEVVHQIAFGLFYRPFV